MTIGLTHSYKIQSDNLDKKRIVQFFDSHPLVYDPEFTSIGDFAFLVTFDWDENDVTRGIVSFINDRAHYMNIFTIMDPKDEHQEELNSSALEHANQLLNDICNVG